MVVVKVLGGDEGGVGCDVVVMMVLFWWFLTCEVGDCQGLRCNIST